MLITSNYFCSLDVLCPFKGFYGSVNCISGNHSYIGNISIVRKDDKKWNSSELTDYLQDLVNIEFLYTDGKK